MPVKQPSVNHRTDCPISLQHRSRSVLQYTSHRNPAPYFDGDHQTAEDRPEYGNVYRYGNATVMLTAATELLSATITHVSSSCCLNRLAGGVHVISIFAHWGSSLSRRERSVATKMPKCHSAETLDVSNMSLLV
jgi:hypothetical protein